VADNTTINTMSGGDVISTDDIGGVKVQRVKVQHGADGSATDVSSASPMPVTANLVAGTANIGDVDVLTLPALVAGAAVIGAVTQSAGPWTTVERGATIAHGSGSVTTSAAQFIATSATRRSVTVQNLGTDYVWFGATGITVNNGIRLAPGQSLMLDKSPTVALFAIAATGTQTCSFLTESD